MAWDTAVAELRNLLNDNPDDRYCYRKKLFGDINGTNQRFKSFEFRRTTNFTDETLSKPPLGIYLNGVRLSHTAVEYDNVLSGEFLLKVAPTETNSNGTGSVLEATYYYQWFNDDELEEFLTSSAHWLLRGDSWDGIEFGLRPAALYFAAKDALRKMAMRWATRASNTFLLEDQPKKDAQDVANTYSTMSMAYEKSGDKYRNDFYTKSGENLAAISASDFGEVSEVTPRR
jgi:hypothetical protein